MTNLFNGTTHPLQISDLQEILKNRFLQSAINTFIEIPIRKLVGILTLKLILCSFHGTCKPLVPVPPKVVQCQGNSADQQREGSIFEWAEGSGSTACRLSHIYTYICVYIGTGHYCQLVGRQWNSFSYLFISIIGNLLKLARKSAGQT